MSPLRIRKLSVVNQYYCGVKELFKIFYSRGAKSVDSSPLMEVKRNEMSLLRSRIKPAKKRDCEALLGRRKQLCLLLQMRPNRDGVPWERREMKLEEAHQYEDELKELIKKKSPNHPVLKKFFPSTWKAIEAYESALRRLQNYDNPKYPDSPDPKMIGKKVQPT